MNALPEPGILCALALVFGKVHVLNPAMTGAHGEAAQTERGSPIMFTCESESQVESVGLRVRDEL